MKQIPDNLQRPIFSGSTVVMVALVIVILAISMFEGVSAQPALVAMTALAMQFVRETVRQRRAFYENIVQEWIPALQRMAQSEADTLKRNKELSAELLSTRLRLADLIAADEKRLAVQQASAERT